MSVVSPHSMQRNKTYSVTPCASHVASIKAAKSRRVLADSHPLAAGFEPASRNDATGFLKDPNVTLHREMSRNVPDGHFHVFIFSECKFCAIYNGENHFKSED